MARQPRLKKNRPGRESQKNRTRMALVRVAGELMRSGRSPTVSDAAVAADVSRATAYRYFPTREMLLAEVALFASGGPLFAEADNGSVADAVGELVRRVGEWAFANEQALRTLLRLSLDPSTGVRRPGHRVEWIAAALEPVRAQLKAQTYKKLSRALTLLLGIDPIVAMKDIAGASRDETLAALQWTARALVEAAMAECHATPIERNGFGGRAPGAV